MSNRSPKLANIPQLMKSAIQHFQAGRLQPAQAMCQQVLGINPVEVNALHLLGVIAHQEKKHDTAIKFIRKAISINPRVADFHSNLGTALQAKGQNSKAKKCFKLALKLAPNNAMALNNLGNAFLEQGRHDDAVKQYRRCLTLRPGYAVAHYNLGHVLSILEKYDEAKTFYEQALRLKPDYAEAHTGLGTVGKMQGDMEAATSHFRQALLIDPDNADTHGKIGRLYIEQGQLDEAEKSYKRALGLQPDNTSFLTSLGNLFQTQMRVDEAVEYFERALALDPNSADLHLNYSTTQYLLGNYKESIAHCEQALDLRPNFAKAHSNIGRALTTLGQLKEAVTQHDIALKLDPDLIETFSNLLFILNYAPGYTAEEIYAKHVKFSERYELTLANSIAPHTNEPSAKRRIRIGYLSPDFKRHSVAFFIEPVLASHDTRRFEVYCYYNSFHVDNVTQRLQSYAEHWHNIAPMSDEQVAEQIRGDGIDILIDLAGHSGQNRLMVFARKPAPVQVTWLGYLNTTGLNAMDYRITDAFANPPGETDQYHSETLVRMPDSQWCYKPPEDYYPPVTKLAALDTNKVTLGSLHNLAKITPEVITVWAKILNASPNTQLIMVAGGLDQRKKEIIARFTDQNVDPARLTLLKAQSFSNYLALHQKIDINLDSFPYTGGTTTCHSLWMGVPIITLSGDTVFSRGGASLLKVLKLDELIATTTDEYVDIVVRLSNNLHSLSALRTGLRTRMAESALTDAPRFTKHLEDAYSRMWQNWCSQHSN